MKKRIFVLTLLAVFLLSGVAFAAVQAVKVTMNGIEVKGDVPAQIINGRTMVPVRFVSEALGANVQWDAANRWVKITSPRTPDVNSKEWTSDWAKLNYYEAIAFMYNDLMVSTMFVDSDVNAILNSVKTKSAVESSYYNTVMLGINKYDQTIDTIPSILKYTDLPPTDGDEAKNLYSSYKSLMDDYKMVYEKAVKYNGDEAALQEITSTAKRLATKSYDLKLKLTDAKNNCFLKIMEIYTKYTPIAE